MESIDNTGPAEMTGKNPAYLERELGFYPFDLLTGVFLDLCLGCFRDFLCGFETFHVRVVFLRELCNRNISHGLCNTGELSHLVLTRTFSIFLRKIVTSP